jgi:tripeptide aminopeptidase
MEMINSERLINTFLDLVKIDSESRCEAKIAGVVKAELEKLGATVAFDDAGKKIGGDCGNMIAKVPGTLGKSYFMLNAHLDTVKPGCGVKPVIDGDVIKTDGSTVLGGDDKSGIAIILEVLKTLKEKNIPHVPVEVVLTVCEEIGVAGSKNLNYSLLESKLGLALDDEEIGGFTLGAPAKCVIDVKVHGIKAHAGVEPEKGISAIMVASKAIAKMKLGKIDRETSANIGIIKAEFPVNVVPNLVEIRAEARSRNNDKFKAQVEHMKATFEETAAKHTVVADGETKAARAEVVITPNYAAFTVEKTDHIVQLVKTACRGTGVKPNFKVGLGGSDANHFNEHGIKVIMMGTGMEKVHTEQEFIKKSDMIKAANILASVITTPLPA